MAGQIKRALEKEVTCPLCLDLFKEPKKLPCDHVYCRECLKGLAQRRLQATITCPECRSVTQVPNSDVANFPTAFRMNRLVEAFQEAKEETDFGKQATESPTKSCTVHTSQPLALYCETCKTMLCRDCVIMSKEHAEHRYSYIGEIAEKYRRKYEERLQTTREFSERLHKACLQISVVEDRVSSEEAANQEEIDRAFEELYTIQEENKRLLKRKLNQEYQSALDYLVKQKRETKSVQAETAHVSMLIESVLRRANEVVLAQEELVEKNVKKVQKQIEQLPLTVSEPLLPVAEIVSCETLRQYLDTTNFLYTPAEPSKCQVEGSFLSRAEMGKYYVLKVDLVDSKGNRCLRGSHKLKAELSSSRDDTKTLGRIKFLSTCPESASITFESQKRGRNKLSITTRGVHIANSPRSVYVHVPPPQLGKPVAQVGNLERPTGITNCGNSILVIEHSRNRILKLNTLYEVVAVYGEEQLKGPSELTTDQEMNIYVCTVLDNRIHKFTCNGEFIKSTGGKGTLTGQFNFPNGIRVSPQDELYICDSDNNRLQVFDLQLGFKRVFGSPGSGKGQFSCPSDVDFDSSGNIYISDTNNHRIQVFNSQERYVRTIGHKRFGTSELQHPINMHIVNDFLFVTEFQKNHVTVFKTSGEFVTIFGKGFLQQPEGLEVDVDGYVYVTSHFSKVFVF